MTKTVLITGANGEIGHGLITYLTESSDVKIVALDVQALDDDLRKRCSQTIIGDILDTALLDQLAAQHQFHSVFHLAAVLSTKAERQPLLGHRVNVDGTIHLLAMVAEQARAEEREIIFLYPSSIAVYGLSSVAEKMHAGKVREESHLFPRTMYGINKLYGERLGRYYSSFYRQLDIQSSIGRVDFRGIRFPGLISAATLPTGGTSDYAPEMLHHSAHGEPYACFVRSDTRIPFMAMPDAIKALLKLEEAPRQKLTKFSYNVGSFNPSAGEILEMIKTSFPSARVTFEPDMRRQLIVDSWPEDIDDSAARYDWGWQPEYDFRRAFEKYLIPSVRKLYGT